MLQKTTKKIYISACDLLKKKTINTYIWLKICTYYEGYSIVFLKQIG